MTIMHLRMWGTMSMAGLPPYRVEKVWYRSVELLMCSLMFTPGSRGGTGDMAESRVTPMLWIRSVSIMNTGGSRIAMSA